MPVTISRKLRIKPGATLFTINAPKDFEKKLAPLPENVKLAKTPKNPDQVHWFVQNKEQMEQELDQVLPLIQPAVTCWIYYPKGTSGMQTNLTRDKGWDKLLAFKQFHWISLVSFDDTWSAFGCRLKMEADEKKIQKPAARPIMEWIDTATKTVKLPPDLEKEFTRHKKAGTFFNQLSFTNRKEYVEWIVTAKKAATRLERVTATIERLENGWKNPANR